MPGRNAQVARIYAILDLLEQTPGGLSVAEITERVSDRGHEASKRTVYRDLEALSQAGFPLFPEDGKTDDGGTRWVLEKKAKINQYLVLSARELFALYLARGVLVPLKSTPFYEDLESIFQKFEEKLGSKHRQHLQSLSAELKFEPGPQWGLGLNPDILETVRAACSEGHLLSCLYNSTNSKSETQRKLGPHYMYYAKGGLYLVAEDFKDRKVKVFALPRMKDVEMLSEHYEGEISTPEEYFGGALGVYSSGSIYEVAIDFSANVASFVRERRWHPSQRVIQRDGGAIRLHLEVASTPELWQWILGFGPDAEVVSPKGVREKVAELAQKTAKKYLSTKRIA